MYGRGVFDMKSVAIAQLLALIDLKESGRPLQRSVLFLATSSEERGSRLGVRRILAEKPEMVRSFWAVLTEGGVVEARARNDIKFWGTETGQKRYADLVVRTGRREPLDRLRDQLKETGHTETDLKVVPEVREVLKTYAATRDRGDLRDLLEDPDGTIRDPARFHKLPEYLRSFFRNEAVPFQVKEAPPLLPPLDRHRLPLLPGGRRALLRLLPLPDHEHRHPAGGQGQRALRPAGVRGRSEGLPRSGPEARPAPRCHFLSDFAKQHL
jgi:hypothetical protein